MIALDIALLVAFGISGLMIYKGAQGQWYLSRPMITGLAYLALSLLATGGLYADYLIRPTYWSWTTTVLGLIPLHLAFSFRKVPLDKMGVVTFLGGPSYEATEPGPVWVPRFLFQLELLPSINMENELPAAREFIYRGNVDDMQKVIKDDPNREKYRPAFRVTHADKDYPEEVRKLIAGTRLGKPQYQQEVQNEVDTFLRFVKSVGEGNRKVSPLYTKEITSEVSLYVRWRISLPSPLIRNFGSVDQVNKLIEDTAMGVITGNLPKITYGSARLLNDQINRAFRREINRQLVNGRRQTQPNNRGDQRVDVFDLADEDLDNLVGSLGVTIDEARVRENNLNKDTNTEMMKAVQSEFEAIRVENLAKAERIKLAEIGTGNAEAKRQDLYADADGQAERALVAESEAGKYALAIEAAQDSFVHSKHTMIVGGGGGLGDMLGAAAAIVDAAKNLTSSGGTTAPSNPQSPATRQERQSTAEERRRNRQLRRQQQDAARLGQPAPQPNETPPAATPPAAE